MRNLARLGAGALAMGLILAACGRLPAGSAAGLDPQKVTVTYWNQVQSGAMAGYNLDLQPGGQASANWRGPCQPIPASSTNAGGGIAMPMPICGRVVIAQATWSTDQIRAALDATFAAGFPTLSPVPPAVSGTGVASPGQVITITAVPNSSSPAVPSTPGSPIPLPNPLPGPSWTLTVSSTAPDGSTIEASVSGSENQKNPYDATWGAAAFPTLDPSKQPDGNVRAAAEAALKTQVSAGGPYDLLDAQKTQWRDGCLGVNDPSLICAQHIVDGWSLSYRTGGGWWSVHTDLTGSQAVVDKNSMPWPCGGPMMGAAGASSAMDIRCIPPPCALSASGLKGSAGTSAIDIRCIPPPCALNASGLKGSAGTSAMDIRCIPPPCALNVGCPPPCLGATPIACPAPTPICLECPPPPPTCVAGQPCPAPTTWCPPCNSNPCPLAPCYIGTAPPGSGGTTTAPPPNSGAGGLPGSCPPYTPPPCVNSHPACLPPVPACGVQSVP